MRSLRVLPLPSLHVTVATLGALALATVGCAKPPELPPGDSMEFGNFTKGKAGALSNESEGAGAPAGEGGAGTANVDRAAAAVGLVTLGVNLALLTPRLVFWGVLTADPEHDGKVWTWDKTFALEGWKAQLRGEVKQKLELEMRVTALRGEQVGKIDNFLWYTGSHAAQSGQWVIYAPEKTGPVIDIDWARAGATDKDLTFTNVTTGEDASGDILKYALKGRLASMTIHDAKNDKGAPADFSVVWHVDNGSGKMTAAGMGYCWDTIQQGQIDITCPSGDYPAP